MNQNTRGGWLCFVLPVVAVLWLGVVVVWETNSLTLGMLIPGFYLNPVVALVICLTIIFYLIVIAFFYPKPKPVLSELLPVTLVVPAVNEELVLEGCVRSLLAVDYPNDLLEVLIVVEGSCTDTTPEIAKRLSSEHSNVRVLVNNGRHEGSKAGALNLALLHARGEILGVYDADHHAEPDVVKHAVAWFNQDPSLGAVGGRCSVRNRGRSLVSRIVGAEFAPGLDIARFIEQSLSGSHFVYGSNMFLSKKALEKIGGFDESMMAEDKDVGMRLIQHGYNTKLEYLMVSWELAPTNFSDYWKQRKRWDRGRFQLLNKFSSNMGTSPGLRRALPLIYIQVSSYALVLVYVGYLIFSLYVALANPLIYLIHLSPLAILFVSGTVRDYRKGMADALDIVLSLFMPVYVLSRAFIGLRALWEELMDYDSTWHHTTRAP